MNGTIRTAAEMIAAERTEQVVKHHRTADVDDSYTDERLLDAAIAVLREDRALWPKTMDMRVFDHATEKSTRDRLVIGAALLAAEIDRITRALDRVDGAVPATTYPAPGTNARVTRAVWELGLSAGLSEQELEQLTTLIDRDAVVLSTTVENGVEWSTITLLGHRVHHRVPYRALRFPIYQTQH